MKNRMMQFGTMLASVFLGSLLVLQIVHATYPAPPSLESEVFVDGGNGFGSTGNHARRYSNIDVNVGTDITYTDDSVNGGYFTINTNGLYSISTSDWRNDGNYDDFGISVNATPSSPIPTSNLGLCNTAVQSYDQSSCSATVYLNAGDVLRSHWATGQFGVQTYPGDVWARFIIVKVK